MSHLSIKPMIARTFPLPALAFASAFSSACAQNLPTPQPASQTQPNIVFIMADDLGWQDVGFMGSSYFKTPNLDKLAAESLVFTNAYQYPTCSPSRAALLTGKHSFRTGVYTVPVLERGKFKDNIFSRWTVETKHPVYAKPLRDAGYRLIHLGKWHIVGPNPHLEKNYPFKRHLSQPGNGALAWAEKHKTPEIQKYYPLGRGFHENVAGTWWGDPARGHKTGYKHPGGGYVSPFNNPFIPRETAGEWLTDRLTTEALDFIKRNQSNNQPFFVNLHFYAPHRPSIKRSEQAYQSFLNQPADPNTGQGADPRCQKEIAAYATMVQALDQNVGRIIDYLNENNLRDNTIIFFTSDNGFNGMQSSTNNLRGYKGMIYEGGIRVPALINWPGHVNPNRTDTPIAGIDYFPTFLDLAGIKNHNLTLDGASLLPLIQNKTLAPRPLYWHIASRYKHGPVSVIRQGDHKLIQFLLDGNIELYDLKNDPTESNNLATAEPELAAQLTSQLTNWRKTNSVPLPPSSPLPY